jgi:hypothetical protein
MLVEYYRLLVEKIEITDLAEANNAKNLPDKSGKQQHLEKKY